MLNFDIAPINSDNAVSSVLYRSIDRIEGPKSPLTYSRKRENHEFLGAASRRIVAAASLTAASDGDIGEGKVRAAVRAAKNVVVIGIVSRCALNIVEGDTADGNAIGWVTSSTTIEVVLLDIDAIVGDARDGDVLVDNVAHLYTCQ